MLWQEFRGLYEEFSVPHRYSTFSTSRLFTNTKVAGKLRGSAVRVKWMGCVLKELWRRHMKANLEIHRFILRCLESSWEMEQILDIHKAVVKLPTDAAVALQRASFCMAQSYTATNEHFNIAADVRPGLFCRTRKLHQLLHATINAKY